LKCSKNLFSYCVQITERKYSKGTKNTLKLWGYLNYGGLKCEKDFDHARETVRIT